MKTINIVLFEPQIPQNTGNIARTCAVTGARLHLVGPLGFEIDDRKLKRAGLDYWDKLDITYYDDVRDFYARNPDCICYYFTTKALNRYTDISYPDNCYIVFGREDKGIDEDILYANKDNCVRVPMTPHLRSLNLSNTVAIAVYEVLRQWDFEGLETQGKLSKYDWETE
ncbi:MAG: tRNA (cytidine(34)-2'-O)-methyltransferase [Oscillospiraceae bacterium]|nr:tRNA (cytidine(34)-2'-O)-methyltransferase [Oscillospiraceae bacterium]